MVLKGKKYNKITLANEARRWMIIAKILKFGGSSVEILTIDRMSLNIYEKGEVKSVWPLVVFVVLLAIVCYEKDATWWAFFIWVLFFSSNLSH